MHVYYISLVYASYLYYMTCYLMDFTVLCLMTCCYILLFHNTLKCEVPPTLHAIPKTPSMMYPTFIKIHQLTWGTGGNMRISIRVRVYSGIRMCTMFPVLPAVLQGTEGSASSLSCLLS